MPNKRGVLYGVGVGPGDPRLITLKALEVLRSVSVIFAASSSKNDHSIAQEVVKALLLPGRPSFTRLAFPMTREEGARRAAWEENARRVLAVLESGRDAAFITLGDPMTYSTFGYLMRTIRRLDESVRISIVPGVTSYHAAAASLNQVLAEDDENLVILSGVADPGRIRALSREADNVVILKPYKNLERILDELEEVKPERRIALVCRTGLADERLERDASKLRREPIPYLSLLILKGGPAAGK